MTNHRLRQWQFSLGGRFWYPRPGRIEPIEEVWWHQASWAWASVKKRNVFIQTWKIFSLYSLFHYSDYFIFGGLCGFKFKQGEKNHLCSHKRGIWEKIAFSFPLYVFLHKYINWRFSFCTKGTKSCINRKSLNTIFSRNET